MYRNNADSSFCFINRLNGALHDELQQPGEHEPTSALLNYCKRKVRSPKHSQRTDDLLFVYFAVVPASLCGHPDAGRPQSHLHGHEQCARLLQLCPGTDCALRAARWLRAALSMRLSVSKKTKAEKKHP